MAEQQSKPGWKTSEFWITLLVLVAASLVASGAIGEETGLGRVLALALAFSQTLGYTAGRVYGKAQAAKAGPVIDAKTLVDAIGKTLRKDPPPA